MATWRDFRRALSKEDRKTFDNLFRLAKRHIAEASHAKRLIPFDALVMCILLEQQKEIERLQSDAEKRAIRLLPFRMER